MPVTQKYNAISPIFFLQEKPSELSLLSALDSKMADSIAC